MAYVQNAVFAPFRSWTEIRSRVGTMGHPSECQRPPSKLVPGARPKTTCASRNQGSNNVEQCETESWQANECVTKLAFAPDGKTLVGGCRGKMREPERVRQLADIEEEKRGPVLLWRFEQAKPPSRNAPASESGSFMFPNTERKWLCDLHMGSPRVSPSRLDSWRNTPVAWMRVRKTCKRKATKVDGTRRVSCHSSIPPEK
jgi:hypothetical protein